MHEYQVALTHGPENVRPQVKMTDDNGRFCFEVCWLIYDDYLLFNNLCWLTCNGSFCYEVCWLTEYNYLLLNNWLGTCVVFFQKL